MIRFAAIFLFIASVSLTVRAQITSVYTDLTNKKCRTLKTFPDEGGSYLGECPGVSGYKLQLLEGDLRQSINVIDPKRKKTELNLWNVSGGFSSLGEQAEWRMKGRTPVALIVRFNVSEVPEDSSRITSYLVVIKITKDAICVTEALKPTRSHNYEARRAADKSALRPCSYR
ncbi:MAG TPA: hypothetical protein VL572_08000 [Pyrinomonadaceae bacterium]|jgi:hypothetical protein|nr:hypothetical protein [Pyrinomonadaceae bacterium]